MLHIAMAAAATLVALTATVGVAAARDGCGNGWYWNGNQCAPTRAERELRNEDRFRDEQRFRDTRRSNWWREGGRDFRDNEYRDRDYTTGYSSNRRYDSCRDGYRRIDGRCIWVGRDRL